MSQKPLGFALVVERLPVTADKLYFPTKSTLRFEHSVGVEFSQQEVEPRQTGDTGFGGVHGREHGAADIFRVRELGVTEQLERRAPPPASASRRQGLAWDAHQRDVDPVGRGSAHDPRDNHDGGRPSIPSKRAANRTCSENSHSCRESCCTFFGPGVAILRFNSADFFLKARTRAADS